MTKQDEIKALETVTGGSVAIGNLRNGEDVSGQRIAELRVPSTLYGTRLEDNNEWLEGTKVSLEEKENMENGESIGNSLELQQWSETEMNNLASTQTSEGSGDSQTENSCRVTWCKHPGQRFGLCWVHGGVKKCCHRNCPKIALATGEFCSIHKREISM